MPNYSLWSGSSGSTTVRFVLHPIGRSPEEWNVSLDIKYYANGLGQPLYHMILASSFM